MDKCRLLQSPRRVARPEERGAWLSRPHWALLIISVFLSIAALACDAGRAPAGEPGKRAVVREIFVPFEDLEVLLENQPRRVMLSRKEYEALVAKARQVPEARAPQAVVLVSAEYTAEVEKDRARIQGVLTLDVLEDGLHAVPLELSGVGLRSAMLDDKAAPLGTADDGRLTLFVEGRGSHVLTLRMVLPLETTAAQQVLRYRLPHPAATRFQLSVPGDVEVKSGADVASRVVDETAGVTRFELVPPPGETMLVMTLNSHLARRQRAVLARSVLVDEVTQAYERLHATVSFEILHQAVDRFRFVVPEGFEITDVDSPLLSRWEIVAENERRVLDVRLREQATGSVVLTLSAIRTTGAPDPWTLARLEPLDVVSQVSVVGLLVDERLEAESIAAEGLIPIDVAVLRQAIPETVFRAEPGAPPLRPVVAFYAPQAAFRLSARFPRPPAEKSATTKVVLRVQEKGLEAQGTFTLRPAVEKLFGFDFTLPADWQITGMKAGDGKPVRYECYASPGEPGRVQVQLEEGVPPGREVSIEFTAAHSPAGWLAEGPAKLEFPVFSVAEASREEGALVVCPGDDLSVRPETVDGLFPLDENELGRYGWTAGAGNLAYRFDATPYRAVLEVERTEPRLTARTYSFLRVRPETLEAHYEIVYRVEEARTQQVALLLPADTPAALSIRGLDNVKLKEYSAEAAGAMRRWNVLLEEPRRDTIRLAVDFQQPLAGEEAEGLALPLVAADGVVYQSGLVAVEGSPEAEVRIATKARRVDVGELVEADYQPGRNLLGAYGFVGDPAEVKVDVVRHPSYRLHPAIVEKAELTTFVAANGVSQNAACFTLRTKALFLEVQLPPKAELWAAELDGQPVKPQREAKSLLVSLPAAPAETARALRIVYQMPIDRLALSGTLDLPAPKLLLHADKDAPSVEVPLVDLAWRLYVPAGYEVVGSHGTVVTELARPRPAILTAARWAAGSLLIPSPMIIRRSVRHFPSDAETHPASAADDGPFASAAGEALAPAEELPPSDEAPMFEDAESAIRADLAKKQASPQAQEAAQEPVAGRPGADRSRGGEEVYGAQAGEQPFAQAPAENEEVFRGRALRRPGKPPASALGKSPGLFTQLGFRSLQIDLEPMAADGASPVTFQSLGVDPRLAVTLVHRPRIDTLGWALALTVGLAGLALGGRSLRAKARFVLAIVVLGTLLPLIPGGERFLGPANMAVYAACLLVPYYLLAGAVKRLVRFVHGRQDLQKVAPPIAASLVVALLAPCVQAAEPGEKNGPYVIQVVEPVEPIKVPEDAIILPYDPESDEGVRNVDRLLVPYAKYVELWNRAYPDKKLETPPPPADYALAGASYRTKLAGDESLLVEGQLEIDVYAEGEVTIPLGLAGGVLTRASLDGKPARIRVAAPAGPPSANQPAQAPPQQAAQQVAGPAPEPFRPFLLLHVSGQGRHRLELTVRLRLERRGGWRVVEGILPAAPASALSITAAEPQTEVRLAQVLDRSGYETERPDEEIQTTLGLGGRLHLQWRPKVAEAQVDRSLTARSGAVLDVQEDCLRLTWRLRLEFPRSQRDTFTVQVPAAYLVEQIEGSNVRGWEMKDADPPTLEVFLLNTARDQEALTIRLRRTGSVGEGALAEFDVPMVTVPEAALHHGELTIRRSPLLDVRSLSASGVTRTDLPDLVARAPRHEENREENPLGLRPYQAYRFARTPFAVRLAVAPVEPKATASLQTILRIAEHRRSLESRINLNVENRPLYQAEIFLPEELELETVTAPGEFHWAVTRRDERPLLTVSLTAGQMGQVPIVLSGSLGRKPATEPVALPRLEVLGVVRQQGDIAVQVDPAFEVSSRDLVNCETVLLHRVHAWLTPAQQRLARLALHYRRPDYRGTLQLRARKPLVTCDTITNVRVTDRAIEETVFLDFSIRQAGIRQVEFLLPAWMKQARIHVPMLRQKTIEPAAEKPGAPLLVRLELQDEVMDQLRVLVENDRLLTPEAQTAPIPGVRTGRTDRQFVALENAGRDELVVEKSEGLERLTRQQREWGKLTAIFGDHLTQAYLVSSDAPRPRLVFKTHERTAVETSGARIGLAETNLVLDSHGAYRAEQIYRLDNTTEQFLEIELPQGATLWTAWVAGEPVKPTQVPGAGKTVGVRIPLVKTAPGDLDYPVVLKYGGRLPPPEIFREVDFPLIRTVNVRVELSQVRLHLPETHRWFDFGGTMGLAADEEELTAGYLAYQTKVAQRLRKALQSSSDFAQVRAANSLKSLKEAILSADDYSSLGRQEGQVQREYQRSLEVLEQAEQEVRQREDAPAGQAASYNRARLVDLYQGQKASRAKNVVQDLRQNFAPPTAPTPFPSAGKEPQFDPQWFEQNKLRSSVNKSGDRLQRVGGGKAGQAAANDYEARVRLVEPKAAQPPPVAAPSAPASGPQQAVEGRMQLKGDRREEGKRDLVNRYQQEHMAQQQRQQLQLNAPAERPPRVSAPARSSGHSFSIGINRDGGAEASAAGAESDAFDPAWAAMGGMGTPGAAPMDDMDFRGGFGTGGQDALPAGLASLDFPLPRRGVVYRFSTPQGDVAITARAVSQDLIAGLGRAAAILALALVVLATVRLLPRVRWLRSRPAGIALLALGLLSLCVFPMLGIVLFLTGLTIAIQRSGHPQDLRTKEGADPS